MDETPTPNTQNYLPIPWPTYRRYIYFWHFITLGSLGVSLFIIIRSNWANWSWQGIIVCLALIAQVALYLRLSVFGEYPWPRWLLPTYFIGSLVLWLVEVILAPELFWLGFAYLGQMYGMLALLPAIIGTIFVLLVIFFGLNFPGWTELSVAEWFGYLAGWGSILVLLIYINHLGRTSRERARLIDELKRTQLELEAARQKESELAVMRERERLARDMHDTLGHNLVTLSVQLEAVQRLYQVDPQSASELLQDLKQLTRSSMEELRHTLAGLRAPGLQDRPLSLAIQELCIDLDERIGLQVDFRIDKNVEQLPPAVAEVIWMCVQEALMNVEKHAKAQKVRLELNLNPNELLFFVEDDGIGFEPHSTEMHGHFGLIGMIERVEGVGGKFELFSKPGEGTRLVLRIPILEKMK